MILKGWLEIFLGYLRMIAALAEDLASVLSTHTGQLATTLTLDPGDPAPYSGVHGPTHRLRTADRISWSSEWPRLSSSQRWS